MKKFWLVLACLLIASTVYAGWETFTIQCDSNTATQVRDARYGRDELIFHNPNSTYSIYVSSWPSTGTTGTFEIEPLGYYWPEYPESGAYFILSEPGQALITISGLERW